MIDEQFLSLLQSRIQDIKSSNNIKYERKLDSLLRVSSYIDQLKPKSKYRSFKNDIIHFVDYLRLHPNIDKHNYFLKANERLSDLIVFLQSKHSFMYKDDWLLAGFYNLVFDIILFLVGLGKFYFYIPIFTIISIVRNVKRIKKAEKEGKILDF